MTEETKERMGRGDGYMNHLKTVGCGPGQNSGEPKPASFSPGLHLGPTAQRDRPEKKEEEGLRLWASVEVHPLSLLLSSHLRNVSKLGAREPQPLEVRLCSLNPAVTPRTRWQWTEGETQILLVSPFIPKAEQTLLTLLPFSEGREPRWPSVSLDCHHPGCKLLMRN